MQYTLHGSGVQNGDTQNDVSTRKLIEGFASKRIHQTAVDTFINVNSAVKLVRLVTLTTLVNNSNTTDKKGQFSAD